MARDTYTKPYYLQRKMRSLKRKIIWNYLQKKLDVILVSEFPKSGGTWYAKMLAEILSLPFPRNNSPLKFENSVLHGHVNFSEKFHKPIYVIRDGRDVVTSAYYHFLFENEHNIPEFVYSNRKKLGFNDYNDIRNNLHIFIEYLFNDYGKKLGHTTWSGFIRDWHNTNALQIKYEDLLIQPTEEMIKSIKYLGKRVDKDRIINVVENNKFKNIAKKADNNKMSFARKGIAGDWKNTFDSKSKQIFKELAGKELIMLNYEKDNDW